MNDKRYATCACEHCGEHIEFEISHIGEKTLCPHCGIPTVLDPLAPPPPPPPAQPKTPLVGGRKRNRDAQPYRPKKSESKRTYIKHIRRNSLYPCLRAVANLVAALMVLTGILGFISLGFESVATGSVARDTSFMLFFGFSFGVIIIGIATREACFAAVDIADVLMNESWRRESQTNNQASQNLH